MTTTFVPQTDPYLLPSGDFDAFLGEIGQRVGWMRSHSCPCVWSQSGLFPPSGGGPLTPQNRLSTPGSPQKGCKTCLGQGFYWDLPSDPFRAGISFRHLSPSPDEPGNVQDEKYGALVSSEPALTIPYVNPFLEEGDPRQPTTAWLNASVNDLFAAIDMLARYTAVLQVGGLQNLPFQQNLSVAPSGAVVVWDPTTQQIAPVSGYVVSGATVTLPAGYASGVSYMVEFQAASLFVAFRRAGGVPHDRQFGGNVVNLPKAFRLQTLDYWTRQRGLQPVVNINDQVLALQIGAPVASPY